MFAAGPDRLFVQVTMLPDSQGCASLLNPQELPPVHHETRSN